ncbi:MAG: hypothetical protein V4447_00495 [Pseudomonadota bacterium]
MKLYTHYLPQFASSIVLCAMTMSAALAQGVPPTSGTEAGDPARWYQEDVTPQARFLSSKKEADAAYKEAVTECKKLEPAYRSNCIREARAQLMQDIDSAKKKLLSRAP